MHRRPSVGVAIGVLKDIELGLGRFVPIEHTFHFYFHFQDFPTRVHEGMAQLGNGKELRNRVYRFLGHQLKSEFS